MRTVLQRVRWARVRIDGETVGEIGPGILALVAARHGDTDAESAWLADKIANLRVFPDDDGRMNRSVTETGGAVLVVSQFTLYGDCRRGRRPGYSGAAAPEVAEPLVESVAAHLEHLAVPVARGRFGADMKVELLNDGPVTLVIDRDPPA